MGHLINIEDFSKTKRSHEGYIKAEKKIRSYIRWANKRLLIHSTIDPSKLDEEGKREAGEIALKLLCLKSCMKMILLHVRDKKPVPEELLTKWKSLLEEV